MVNFRSITEDNFYQIIKMKRPDGEHYVASNAISLAECWLYRNNNDVYPFAIYDDDLLVGFMLLDEDLEERSLAIWRISIPEEYTNKGYGTKAIQMIIDLAKESGKYDYLVLDYVKGNDRAKHVYEKLGFAPTGEISNGEIVMKYEF